jgi:probable selenium-dependent hydroxylase accessory protein YqeC
MTGVMIDKILNLDRTPRELICFVGAGGKTTAITRLARELKGRGKRVLVTTTTAMYRPDVVWCDELIVTHSQESPSFQQVKNGNIICLGREISSENKLLGVGSLLIDEIYQKKLFDCILVEGDGSRRRPVKAPAAHEPVVPRTTTTLVGVIGLDALGRTIDHSCVHRPELFCRITGCEMGDAITEETIAGLIGSAQGLFKTAPEGCKIFLLLNKAENHQRRNSALRIIELVKREKGTVAGFLVGALAEGQVISVK